MGGGGSGEAARGSWCVLLLYASSACGGMRAAIRRLRRVHGACAPCATAEARMQSAALGAAAARRPRGTPPLAAAAPAAIAAGAGGQTPCQPGPRGGYGSLASVLRSAGSSTSRPMASLVRPDRARWKLDGASELWRVVVRVSKAAASGRSAGSGAASAGREPSTQRFPPRSLIFGTPLLPLEQESVRYLQLPAQINVSRVHSSSWSPSGAACRC